MAAITGKLVPASLKAALPLDGPALESVQQGRQAIRNLLENPRPDGRLLVMIGPCSIHDSAAGLDYAKRLAAVSQKHSRELLIAMRVYIEKPRTTVGWKGLVHDPELTQGPSSDLAKGLHASREIMIQVAGLGLPVVTEMLSPFVLPFLEDVLACGVIGARTTESQTHRELASDVDIPVGFKNGTDGTLGVAIDAIKASSRPHTLASIDQEGYLTQRLSRGNPDTFVVMRGGKDGPNYSPEHIQKAAAALTKAGQEPRLVVDCSHGNSSKDYRNQPKVASSVAQQFVSGAPIVGLMLESNIRAGRQDLPTDGPACLEYGVSITDGCVGWEETETILDELALAVKERANAQMKTFDLEHPVAGFSSTRDARRSSFNQFMEKLRGSIPTVEISRG